MLRQIAEVESTEFSVAVVIKHTLIVLLVLLVLLVLRLVLLGHFFTPAWGIQKRKSKCKRKRKPRCYSAEAKPEENGERMIGLQVRLPQHPFCGSCHSSL